MQTEMTAGNLLPQSHSFNITEASIRHFIINNQPWFVANDVCKALGLSNTTMALKALDEDEKALSKVEGLTGLQEANIIDESGLYALIMRSNKPEAKRFRKWVTRTVLPSIRKTGRFGSRYSQSDVEILKFLKRHIKIGDIPMIAKRVGVSRHAVSATKNGRMTSQRIMKALVDQAKQNKSLGTQIKIAYPQISIA